MRTWLTVLVASLLLLGTALPGQRAPSEGLIARIEGPQVPDRQGFDAFTIDELLDRFGVPGHSGAEDTVIPVSAVPSPACPGTDSS